MCKKWRSCLFSLVSVCCILSMLFLDTCVVKAATINDFFDGYVVSGASKTITFNININPSNSTAVLTDYPTTFSGTGRGFDSSNSSFSGSFTHTTIQGSVDYYTYHFSIPLNLYYQTSSVINGADLYGLIYVLYSPTSTVGTITNANLIHDNIPVSVAGDNSFRVLYKNGKDIIDGNTSTSSVGSFCTLEFDYQYSSTDYSSTDSDVVTTSIAVPSACWIGHVKDSITSSGTPVSDSGTQHELQELNNTQESMKDTAEDTNSKITDFFGNFFSNLVGVFVPGSSYFSDWFTRVNNLLADKLGILYFPFDFIIDTLTTINSNSSTSSGQIIFPEMSFTNSATSETYTLLNRQVINLNDYDVPFSSSENSSLVGTTNFTSLLSIIRLFTGIAFTLALIHLFIDKLHLILRGSERG